MHIIIRVSRKTKNFGGIVRQRIIPNPNIIRRIPIFLPLPHFFIQSPISAYYLLYYTDYWKNGYKKRVTEIPLLF